MTNDDRARTDTAVVRQVLLLLARELVWRGHTALSLTFRGGVQCALRVNVFITALYALFSRCHCVYQRCCAFLPPSLHFAIFLHLLAFKSKLGFVYANARHWRCCCCRNRRGRRCHCRFESGIPKVIAHFVAQASPKRVADQPAVSIDSGRVALY